MMLVATGAFGTVAAIVTEEYEALSATLPFIGLGISGLALLRGSKGPVDYDSAQLMTAPEKDKAGV
jgi:hypothetical protein